MKNLLLLLSLIFVTSTANAGQKVTGDLQVTGLVSCANVKTDGTGLMSCNTTTYLTSVTAHNLLSTTHGDTTAGSVTRGDIIIGDATPKWVDLAKGTSGYVLTAGAADVSWAAIPAESDPQVNAVTNGKWCIGTGTQVTCDQNAPEGGGGGGWTVDSEDTTYGGYSETNLEANYGINAPGTAVNNQSECSDAEVFGDQMSCEGGGCTWFDDGYCEGDGACSSQPTEANCNALFCDPGWTSGNTSCIATAEAAIPDNVGQGLFYYPQRSSFRVGKTTDEQNYDANVGLFSTAFGKNNTASGNLSFASGRENIASGAWSFAAGLTNTASATGTVAMGTSCQSTSPGAVCIGRVNTVSGTGAVAMGYGNTASGEACFVVGDTSVCGGLGSISMGSVCYANGLGSVAIGSDAVANIDGAMAFGAGVRSNASGAMSQGFWTWANGIGSMSINDNTTAGGSGSLAANNGSMAMGVASFAGGYGSVTTGSEAMAFGNNALASGDSSLALGEANSSRGKASFSAGSTNDVQAPYSYAIGRDCTVTGTNSFCVNLGTDDGTGGSCVQSSYYDCSLNDEDETACLAHGCNYEGDNCDMPTEKIQPSLCSGVVKGKYVWGKGDSQTDCEKLAGCSWNGDNAWDGVCEADEACSGLFTQSNCNAQSGCSWVETFAENPETVSQDGAFVIMNAKVGINDESPSFELEVTGEAKVSGISGDGTGKAVCIKSDGALGTCSTAPNASGVCTCG